MKLTFCLSVLIVTAQGLAQACAPIWSSKFRPLDVDPWPSSGTSINGAAVFDDDGPGPHLPALYVSGNFSTFGGSTGGPGIARWNGVRWDPVGTGAIGGGDLVVCDDDGAGPHTPALYTIGSLNNTPAIIKWNGQQWTAVASGPGFFGGSGGSPYYYTNNLFVLDDDGPGPAYPRLYASVSQSEAHPSGLQYSGRLMRLDPGGWTFAFTGGQVFDAVTWDPDGTGPQAAALYVAHAFRYDPVIPGEPLSNNAYLTRITPSGNVNLVSSFNPQTLYWSLAVAESASEGGPPDALYLAGRHELAAGGASEYHLSRWSGAALVPIAGGLSGVVDRLHVIADDPSSPGLPAMYATGNFGSIGGVAASNIARWGRDSTGVVRWSSLGPGFDSGPSVLVASDDDGPGPRPRFLYAGGTFLHAGYVAARNIARWDGFFWQPPGPVLNNRVAALLTADVGQGPSLYIGGRFSAADGLPAVSIARWDGQAFSKPPSLNNHVDALAEFQGQIIAAGKFTLAAPNIPVSHIARGNGSSWSPLGNGLSGDVAALAVHDDGSGPALYAGGSFTAAGGQPAAHIARWKGQSWSPLGAGVDDGIVALASYAGELCAAGTFTTAGGQAIPGIARWNGSVWRSVGSNPPAAVTAMAVHRGILYVGGTGPGGTASINAWNGQTWFAIPALPGTGSGLGITALASIDEDGAGPGLPALYASGALDLAGATPARRVARWNGTSWSAPVTGLNAPARAIAAFGAPAKVYFAGDFTEADNRPSWFISSLNPNCFPICLANCDASTVAPVLNIADFVCFLNRFSAEDPYANCDGSSAAPVLNVADFTCFLNAFSAGCP